MKFFAAFLLSLTPVLAVAAPLTVGMIEKNRASCLAGAESNAAMSNCEDKAFRDSDALLTLVYKQKIADTFSPAQKQALIKAERAWIAYRDLDCQGYVGASYEGGNGAGLAIATCTNDRVIERIKALQNF